MHSWLPSSADTLSAETGVRRDVLDLRPEEIDSLLELAAVAAHDSGARTNAPLACRLLGVARGQTHVPLEELVASVTREAAEPPARRLTG